MNEKLGARLKVMGAVRDERLTSDKCREDRRLIQHYSWAMIIKEKIQSGRPVPDLERQYMLQWLPVFSEPLPMPPVRPTLWQRFWGDL